MFADIDEADEELIAAASEVLRANYLPARHTVGAAVRCASGRIFRGINVEACGYGPCAEPIALGTAFSNGERAIVSIVAVHRRGEDFDVISPCGNCRQLIVDYAPEASVIFSVGGKVQKTKALDLLPGCYPSHFDQPYNE